MLCGVCGQIDWLRHEAVRLTRCIVRPVHVHGSGARLPCHEREGGGGCVGGKHLSRKRRGGGGGECLVYMGPGPRAHLRAHQTPLLPPPASPFSPQWPVATSPHHAWLLMHALARGSVLAKSNHGKQKGTRCITSLPPHPSLPSLSSLPARIFANRSIWFFIIYPPPFSTQTATKRKQDHAFFHIIPTPYRGSLLLSSWTTARWATGTAPFESPCVPAGA